MKELHEEVVVIIVALTIMSLMCRVGKYHYVRTKFHSQN